MNSTLGPPCVRQIAQHQRSGSQRSQDRPQAATTSLVTTKLQLQRRAVEARCHFALSRPRLLSLQGRLPSSSSLPATPWMWLQPRGSSSRRAIRSRLQIPTHLAHTDDNMPGQPQRQHQLIRQQPARKHQEQSLMLQKCPLAQDCSMPPTHLALPLGPAEAAHAWERAASRLLVAPAPASCTLSAGLTRVQKRR